MCSVDDCVIEDIVTAIYVAVKNIAQNFIQCILLYIQKSHGVFEKGHFIRTRSLLQTKVAYANRCNFNPQQFQVI